MLKASSYKKGLLSSVGLNVLAKGAFFLNTLVIAYYFGAGQSTDMYYFVIGVAILISSGIINNMDSIIIIPEAMRLRQVEGEKKSRQFLNFFIVLYFLIGVLLFCIVIFVPVFFYSIFSKFDQTILLQHKPMLYAGGALLGLQLLNNFLGAILNSYKYFSIAIIASLVTSVVSILCTILLYERWGIASTLYAVLGSSIVNFILLFFLFKNNLKWRFTDLCFLKNKNIWTNICLFQINILPVWLRNYATLFLLSGLGDGIVTAVNISLQVVGALDALLVAQVLSVIGIKLNELYVQNNFISMNIIINKAAKVLLIISLPITAVIFFNADYIASLIFGNKNITPDKINSIAICLKCLILISPLMILNSFCTKIIAASQLLRKGLLYVIIAHTLFLIIVIVLINLLKLNGYLYGMIIGYITIIFCYYLLFKTHLKQINFLKLLVFMASQAILNFAFAAIVFYIMKYVGGYNNVVNILIALTIQAIFIIILHKKKISLNFITNLAFDANTENDK
ncbi:MAG: hypothetical protein KA319_06115 [Ferruginibacter sp.]|nr:hypothetical protein [Ferruginibacter sp.]